MVSRRVERFFGAHAENYREISARAEWMLGRFADCMSNAAKQYSTAEAANDNTLG
ncbi:PE family protein [Mycobacterium haemophilum DSM 44634]|nr:PE family protein [Mycobacterium haemophilum DSM 44634]